MSDGGKEYKGSVPTVLTNLLNVTWHAQQAMFRVKRLRRRLDTNEREYLMQKQYFKDKLEELYFEYEPKFDYSPDVSVTKNIKQKLKDEGVQALTFDECEQLLQDIRNLQEDLGHKRFERDRHVEDGVGVPGG